MLILCVQVAEVGGVDGICYALSQLVSQHIPNGQTSASTPHGLRACKSILSLCLDKDHLGQAICPALTAARISTDQVDFLVASLSLTADQQAQLGIHLVQSPDSSWHSAGTISS